MTDNKIIQALECCSYATSNRDCEKCPYYPDEECVKKQCTDILDLINRQKAEIGILIRKKNDLQDEITELQAENERLKGDLAFREKQLDNLVKEMTEKGGESDA